MKQKEEFMSNLKAGSSKYDTTIKSLNEQVDELKETMLEKETELLRTK